MSTVILKLDHRELATIVRTLSRVDVRRLCGEPQRFDAIVEKALDAIRPTCTADEGIACTNGYDLLPCDANTWTQPLSEEPSRDR